MSELEENAILVERRDGLGIITVNRPKVLNAVDVPTVLKLQEVAEELIADDSVRIIVLTGTGPRAFIAGGDIGAELAMNGLDSFHWAHIGHKFCSTLENCAKPVIAAIDGYCLGGGLELAMACDFRICTDKAMFGAPECKLGVICGFGGNARLPRLIGPAKAKEFLMSGLFFDAQEAYRLNFVNKVVPQDQLMAAVDEFCVPLLNKSANVLDIIKKMVNYGSEIDLRSAIQFEAAMFGLVSGTEDKKEGMSAFLEKRPSKFTDK
jgi:enoyl-CoA hydratase